MTLEVNRLTVRYGAVAAVRDACITVNDGEVVALIGANGAGKSSILKAAMGLVPHIADALMFGGADLRRAGTIARIEAGFALSPEGRHVFPDMTVLENLLLGFRRGSVSERDQRAERMFALFTRLAERSRPERCPAASSRCLPSPAP
jgi:branched-chain amino acid transport system ATP-binding protein